MSIPYETSGRVGQKTRTRNALVEAAKTLVARGLSPTVEDAAGEASISRTTAYRYFPNQRELLVAAYPFIEAESLLGEQVSEDVFERLDVVLTEHLRFMVAYEPALRAALRLSLEPHDDETRSVLRRGRVIGWVVDALAPLHPAFSDVAIKRLARAIRATAGIEAFVWLTDVAALSRDEAIELMKWSARALLRAAIEDGDVRS